MSESVQDNIIKKVFNESPPIYSTHQHACLTLSMNDRLQLFRFPSTMIDIFRQMINTAWTRGVQAEKQFIDFYEFKCKGNPWLGSGNDYITARILILHILSTLYSYGWSVITSNDFCRLTSDRNSLFFRLGVRPPPTAFFAISRYDIDKLRLICVSNELIKKVKQIFGPQNIQKEEWRDEKYKCYQIKLHDSPWTYEETASSRMKILDLLDCFASFGCQLYTGLYLDESTDSTEANTWIFYRRIQ